MTEEAHSLHCVHPPDDQPGHPERLQLLPSNHQPHADQQRVCKNHWSGDAATDFGPNPAPNRPLPALIQAETGSEVNNELANRMSLFYASATPMLKALSDATSKFVADVSAVLSVL